MLQKLFIAAIRFYQIALSQFVGNCCRFYPSCSHYAIDAIKKYGAFKGTLKCIKRIAKCHPLCKGGVDLP